MSVGVRIRRTRNESSTCKYAVPRLHASRHSFVRPHYDSFEGSACFDAGASTHHQFSLGEDSRLALTGKSVGPGLFELAELLGQSTALERIDQGIAVIETMEESTP